MIAMTGRKARNQSDYRQRKLDAGLVAVSGYVPAELANVVRYAMAALCHDRNLTLQVLHGRDGRPYFIDAPEGKKDG